LSTLRLAEFLAAVSDFRDEASFPARPWSPASTTPRGRLLLARRAGGFSDEEAELVRAMGRVLTLTASMLRTLELLYQPTIDLRTGRIVGLRPWSAGSTRGRLPGRVRPPGRRDL
jgi:hypothetical protein